VLQAPVTVHQMPLQPEPEPFPLAVDVERAVEYGFSPKPATPVTPSKGARLQDKIKALETAAREKGDVLVQGGIKVFPLMAEEKKVEKQEPVRKEFVPETPLEPFKLENQGEFIPPQFASYNEAPKPYEGVPYMPESRPLEVNANKPFELSQPKAFEYKPIAQRPELVTPISIPERELQTPASGYQASVGESEDELRLSTQEKRHLFEQKIKEVASSGPVERQGYVQLYNPEELAEEEQKDYRTLQAKREMFEQKIQEIQESTLPPLIQRADLTSPKPSAVKHPRPLSTNEVGLEPGTPPEMLFSPKFEGQTSEQRTEAHQSMYQQTQEYDHVSQIRPVSAPKPALVPRPAPKQVYQAPPEPPAPMKQTFSTQIHRESHEQRFQQNYQSQPQQVQQSHYQEVCQQLPPVQQNQNYQTYQTQQQVNLTRPVKQSDFRQEYSAQSGPNFSHTESHQEYSSFSQQGFRRVEPPRPTSQAPPVIKPQPVPPSHFERPAEPEPTFRPIPTVPAPPKPAPKPQAFTSYSTDQHSSTHQKIVQHHHQESRSYQQSYQSTQPPKLVKPIPINAATAAPRQAPPTPSQTTQKQFQPLEPFPFKPEPLRSKPSKVPPPPSPSKFIKGEFRESEYESDDSRIRVKWLPHNGTEDLHYKPVRPTLTPTHGGRNTLGRTPTPPTEFDRPPTIEGPPRPKFQPIERQKDVNVPHTQVVRPKPIQAKPIYTQSRSHDERMHREYYSSEPQTKTYYTAIAGNPIHNAIATETSKHMHMKESSEKSQRIVNVTHTHRVIALDDKRQSQHEKLEPFPYSAPPVSMKTRQRVPPPPTPTRFIPGEFRDSDYESEFDSARIRPVWTPTQNENDPRYRPVRAPQGGRATSVPRNYERVMTPMEFDQGPIMPSKIDVFADRDYYNQTQTLDRSMMRKEKSKTTRDDIDVRNKYTSYKSVAKQQIDNMSNQFKDKAHQFIRDISDQQQSQRTVKRASSVTGERKPQFYRDENRVSEYGTKHIDPDTGLIYFKYDFGYEFGIIFPGEGRKIVGGYRNQPPRNEISSQPTVRQAGDIEVPVLHERSASQQREEAAKKRYSLPAHFAADKPTAETWNQHGRTTPSTPVVLGNVVNQEVPQAPKKAPLWITPLRDIAAVSGQTAKFECIVQCEPHPEIYWTKNGEVLQNCSRSVREFRNGVCRLTIPQTMPFDAGQYSCTAANVQGSTTTTAQLIVPSGTKEVRK